MYNLDAISHEKFPNPKGLVICSNPTASHQQIRDLNTGILTLELT